MKKGRQGGTGGRRGEGGIEGRRYEEGEKGSRKVEEGLREEWEMRNVDEQDASTQPRCIIVEGNICAG